MEEEDVPGATLAAVKALQVNTYVPTVLQRMIYIRFGPIPDFTLHSFEQAIAYCREQQVLTWRRVPYRSEFLNAFCSVPEIKDMLDTDQNMTKKYRLAAGGTYGDNHPLQRQTERSSRN